jgi:hypothetical protein
MSAPNGSIANLLVTRKSLIAPNLESPSPVPFPYGREDGLDESANKKAGAGRAPDGLKGFFPPRLAARGSLDDYFWMFA